MTVSPYAPYPLPSQRVGVLGGSFNPAHDGHRHISLVAMKRLNLDHIWWLVTPQNPLKPRNSTAALNDRLAGARRTARHPRIIITDIEAHFGTTYSIDTVTHLQNRYPHTRFVWLMGADNFIQLPRWKRWTDLMARIPVAVIARPGYHLKAGLSQAACRYQASRLTEQRMGLLATMKPPAWALILSKLHPASSTEIRASAR